MPTFDTRPISNSSQPAAKLVTFSSYSEHDNFVVRVLACSGASVSLVCALVAFYWFFRIEKKFRLK